MKRRIQTSAARMAILSAAFAFAACQSGRSPEHRGSSAEPAPVTRVNVSAHGFEPATATLSKGSTLVFRRTTEATCATAVVFPKLGIEKPLPLNTDVTIELPASASGDVGFQCGMGMYKGKVLVQ